jgi:hypothetical protein
MDWLALLGAFGLGSVVTTVVQSLLSSRIEKHGRIFQERKEAYVGLLEAWVEQEDNNFDSKSYRDVGHWFLRSELVASKLVLEALRNWSASDPGSSDRIEATKTLKSKMRDDLSAG